MPAKKIKAGVDRVKDKLDLSLAQFSELRTRARAAVTAAKEQFKTVTEAERAKRRARIRKS